VGRRPAPGRRPWEEPVPSVREATRAWGLELRSEAPLERITGGPSSKGAFVEEGSRPQPRRGERARGNECGAWTVEPCGTSPTVGAHPMKAGGRNLEPYSQKPESHSRGDNPTRRGASREGWSPGGGAREARRRAERSSEDGATCPRRRVCGTGRCSTAGTAAVKRQIGRMFSACGPFWPCVTSNSTFWPSSSSRKP
jgi:hypothetical protein